jgi:hypothetical protein
MSPSAVYGVWGLMLGAGVATVIPYAAFLVIVALQLTSGNPLLSMVAGVLFGLGREVPALHPLINRSLVSDPTKSTQILLRYAHVARNLNVMAILAGAIVILFTSLR